MYITFVMSKTIVLNQFRVIFVLEYVTLLVRIWQQNYCEHTYLQDLAIKVIKTLCVISNHFVALLT